MIDELIAKLESAPAAAQGPLLSEAINFAEAKGWIAPDLAIAARRMIEVGAYESAALVLVPEGWFWRVGRTSIFQAWAWVHKTHPDHGEPGRNEFGWHRENYGPPSTPVLALAIVALKARAA